MLDVNWKSTNNIDDAHILLREHKVTDTCWQFDIYNFAGPLVRTEQFRDQKGEILNGISRYYNTDGNLDSIGSFLNGKMHGDFYKLGLVNDTLRYLAKYRYENNRLVEMIDLQKQDTLKYADEKESEFPGEAGSWGRYLTKNLDYPKRAIDGDVQGTVRVAFTVESSGEVHDPFIFKSVEYSLDEESLRMIRRSGK